MKFVNNQTHPFHLVDPSPWPLTAAIGGFTLTTGLKFKKMSKKFMSSSTIVGQNIESFKYRLDLYLVIICITLTVVLYLTQKQLDQIQAEVNALKVVVELQNLELASVKPQTPFIEWFSGLENKQLLGAGVIVVSILLSFGLYQTFGAHVDLIVPDGSPGTNKLIRENFDSLFKLDSEKLLKVVGKINDSESNLIESIKGSLKVIRGLLSDSANDVRRTQVESVPGEAVINFLTGKR